MFQNTTLTYNTLYRGRIDFGGFNWGAAGGWGGGEGWQGEKHLTLHKIRT